jgi:hypothetical protein
MSQRDLMEAFDLNRYRVRKLLSSAQPELVSPSSNGHHTTTQEDR